MGEHDKSNEGTRGSNKLIIRRWLSSKNAEDTNTKERKKRNKSFLANRKK